MDNNLFKALEKNISKIQTIASHRCMRITSSAPEIIARGKIIAVSLSPSSQPKQMRNDLVSLGFEVEYTMNFEPEYYVYKIKGYTPV